MLPLFSRKTWPKIAVYDIETTDWVHVEMICHVDEYGARESFLSIPEYIEFLAERFEGDHVWAHFGGRFDFRFLLPELTRQGHRWRGVWSGSSLIAFTTVLHGREITFLDSFRLMPSSAKAIGKTIGLEKLDVDRTDMGSLSREEMERYCFRDCDVIVKGLQFLRDTLDDVGCDFAYTLASIASRYVRRSDVVDWGRLCRFDRRSKRWDYEAKNKLAEEFCEPAYFGGRTEVFRRGMFPGHLYYYDVRSSYPWSMTRPLPLYFRDFEPASRAPVHVQLRTMGISRARVHVPHDTYLPVLPVFHGERLTFPTGDFEGTWTNIELLEAAKHGAKIELVVTARFKAAAFLEPFVRSFFEMRKKAIDEGDAFRSYALKILMNSLYGKLIETERKEALIFGAEEYREAIKRHGRDAVFPTEVPGVFSVRSFAEGKFRHCAAGAYVTAYSRVLLHRKLCEARDKGGEVYYCDTDSIICDVPLAEDPALGGLNLEHEFEWGEFLAPKVYRGKILGCEDVIYRVKGIPVGGYDPGEAESRWDRYTSGDSVEKDGISGLKTDLRNGTLEPSALVLKRAMRRPDKKRIHRGVDSRPFALDR